MNPNLLPSDDPLLTAYALGELDLEENTRIAEALKDDPVAQATVDEIRALVRQMEDALESEPVLPATAPLPRASSRQAAVRTNVLSFPVYLVGGLAAACILVIIATRTPSPSSRLIQASSDEANVPLSAPPVSNELSAPLSHESERSPLPLVEIRKRGLSPAVSDVKPAPLRDDGLERWRSVTDIRATPLTPLVSNPSGVAPLLNQKAYSPLGYPTASKQAPVQVADASGRLVNPAAEATPLSEVVPAAALDAAKDEANSAALAANNPGPHDPLKLGFRYNVQTVGLLPHIEFPRINPALDLAFIDKDFKLAVAAAGLGKTLKDAPPKGSTYDQILTWTEENPETVEESAEPRHEPIDAVKKPTKATVE